MSLTKDQREDIRHRVREGIRSIERGDYREYQGHRGLKQLANEVKARGRRLLAKARKNK